MNRRIWLVIAMCFLVPQSWATHFIGGQIHYEYLGNDQYQVTMSAYRDCSSSTDFDDVASIGIFNLAGDLVENLEIELIWNNVTDVDPETNSPCFAAPLDVCIEEAIYSSMITLPPIPGGYTLTYQRCCRNYSIVNIITGDDVGITLTTNIPDQSLAIINSNPEFQTQPPFLICLNAPFAFDHSAIDADGDSLSYALCAPLNSTVDEFYINPPGPPPYPSVVYLPGYSFNYPIDANPAFTIDPVSGMLTGTGTSMGQYVLSICTTEWRNGVPINVTNRDIQLNVTICDPVDAPIINAPSSCSGLSVQFENESADNLTYYWDFGLATATSDTSNLYAPSFTYPTQGVYDVMMILNPGLTCADTTYTTYVTSIELTASITQVSSECSSGQTLYDFSAVASSGNGISYHWNFGNASSPSTANTLNVSNVVLNNAGGPVNVMFWVALGECADTVSQQINAPPYVTAVINPQSVFCSGSTFQFVNSSQNATSFAWDFGAPGMTDVSNLANPSFTFPNPGTYQVQLIASALNACPDTTVSTFVVAEPLMPVINSSMPSCISGQLLYDFTATANATVGASYLWNFGNTSLPVTASTLNVSDVNLGPPGNVANITFRVTQNGCSDSAMVTINVPQDLVAAFEPQTVFCATSTFQFVNLSQNATNFSWDFGAPGNGDVSNAMNPSFTYQNQGTYLVQLIASASNACADTAYQTFITTLALLPVIVDISFECNGGVLYYDFLASDNSTSNATYTWDFGSTANPSIANTQDVNNVTLGSAGGTSNITFTVEQNGCSESVSTTVQVPPNVVADFAPQTLFCSGLTVQFENFSQNATAYSWDFDDLAQGDNSTLLNPSYTYQNGGNHNVQLVATGINLCFDTAYATFEMYGELNAYFELNSPICFDNHLLEFTAEGASSNNAVYSWSFDQNAQPALASSANVSGVSYSQPGVYNVSLSIAENNCIDNYSAQIELIPNPIFSAVVDTLQACYSDTLTMYAQTVTDSPVNYLWNLGDGTISNSASLQHIYQTPGSYDVSLFAETTSGCIDSAYYFFDNVAEIYYPPTAGFVIVENALGIPGVEYEINSTAVGAVDCSYYLSDGGFSSNCDFNYVFENPGVTNIMQVVINEQGCADTAFGSALINGFVFYAPNVFTPDNDGVNDVWIPKMSGVIDYHLSIYDRWGILIFETNDKHQPWTGSVLKGEHYAQNDVYVYRVVIEDLSEIAHDFTGHISVVR